MIVEDEAGPLELIPWHQFPLARGNRRVFESLAAPVSRELDRHASAIGSTSSEVQFASRGDVDADFARTIPGAVGEINGQLGSLSAVDPGRMLAAAREALGEADALAADMAPGGASSASIRSPGRDGFELVQWQIAGHGSSAPSPPPPGAPAPLPPPPGSEDQPPPAPPADSTRPVDPLAPPPAPLTPEESPAGEPSPAPAGLDEIVI